MKPPSKWIPMSRPSDIACIGKLLEELGEAVSAAARSLIQGIESVDPDDPSRPNWLWLSEELADVKALTNLTIDRWDMDRSFIAERVARKSVHKKLWFAMLDEDQEGPSE